MTGKIRCGKPHPGGASLRSAKIDGTLAWMDTGKATRRPLRSTVPLYARVLPRVRALAVRDANKYGLSLSDYMAALIEGQDPAERNNPPAAPVAAAAILGSRVVFCLNALEARIKAGEDCEVLRRDLVDVRRQIADALRGHLPQYVERTEARGGDDWSGE